jgi:hypothetical protein
VCAAPLWVMTNENHVGAGVPTGGQFAAKNNTESDVTLRECQSRCCCCGREATEADWLTDVERQSRCCCCGREATEADWLTDVEQAEFLKAFADERRERLRRGKAAPEDQATEVQAPATDM